MNFSTVAVLGAGSMGGALAEQWASVEDIDHVIVTTSSQRSAEQFSDVSGVDAVSLEQNPAANAKAAAAADIVVLGVKPFAVCDLLASVRPMLRPGVIVVSIAAGVTISSLQAVAPGVSIFCAIPNTPVAIAQGVIGVSAGANVSSEDSETVKSLFAWCGVVIPLPENRMDVLSAISGSGPAYVFFLMEQFTRAACEWGFDPETAQLMVQQTVVGSAALLDSTGHSPEYLRQRVTSPGGTTERAIKVLDNASIDQLFNQAIEQAVIRASELGQKSS